MGFVLGEKPSALRCAVCKDEEGALGKCRGCGTLAHAECAEGGCPTIGCAESARMRRPAWTIPLGFVEAQRRAEDRGWRPWRPEPPTPFRRQEGDLGDFQVDARGEMDAHGETF